MNGLNKKSLTFIFYCAIFFNIASGSQAQNTPQQFDQTQKLTQQAMAVLDEFILQFNSLNIEAWEATYHFPHYRLASGKMTILNEPSGRTPQQLKNALGAEWHHSAWIKRQIVHASPTKIHVDTQFARYREDNSVIAIYDSLYILTNENGRWGIKMRSSMAP